MTTSPTADDDLQYPLLETKLFIPPPRPDQLRRIPLIERLNRGIDRKLTLISAPAGFGKTTLLSEWISQAKMPIAWISLDKSDSDPFQLTHYLIAALKRIHPDFGESTLSQLRSSPRPPIESILIRVIKEATGLAGELVIAFDDGHSIKSETMRRIIGMLLDHLPPRIHVVISTRVDPPLPLARLRVNNQLSELRTVDLCFTAEETTVFFSKTMNLQLTGDEISVLGSRTEGWVAGLQLAAISLQGRSDSSEFIQSFAGDDRHVVDYLVEEVLNLQSEAIQRFLLQTSILNRLSEPLCDAVTGKSGGQKILDELERSNLFVVPLDDKRHWYRYHHLFADLLQQRLRISQDDWINTLHKRASRWYAQNGFEDEAMNHALTARDYEQAGQLIEDYVKRAWAYDSRMPNWHEKLPPEIMDQNPELGFFNAWMLQKSGQYDAAEKGLETTEQLIRAQSTGTAGMSAGPHPDNFKTLKGKIAAIRANIALNRDNIPDAVKFTNIAMEYLPPNDVSWRTHLANFLGQAHFFRGELDKADRIFEDMALEGRRAGDYNAYLKGGLGCAAVLRSRGDLPGAIKFYQELYQSAQEKGLLQSPMIGWLYLNWGKILGYRNDLNEALDYIQRGIEFSRQVNVASMIGEGYLNLGAVLLTKGDVAGVEAIVDTTEELAAQSDLPRWIVEALETLKIRTMLQKGDDGSASQWMKNQEVDEVGKFINFPLPRRLLVSRILFAEGKRDRSLALLRPLVQVSNNDSWVIEQIEALTIHAKILKSGGGLSEACASLIKALSLAAPGGIISTFLEEGPPIAELLQVLIDENENIPRAHAKKVLSAFRLTKLIKTEDEFVERLSERELEVLELIAGGLPNKTITEELFISMSTVKTHLRNIYGKLNVNSRTQAVAKAKKLDFL